MESEGGDGQGVHAHGMGGGQYNPFGPGIRLRFERTPNGIQMTSNSFRRDGGVQGGAGDGAARNGNWWAARFYAVILFVTAECKAAW